MRGTGEHSELGSREVRLARGIIACHAAAEQPKHLHRVLGADDVRIPDYDQGGSLDRLNGLGRPALKLPNQSLHLGDQRRPVFRIRRDPGVGRFPR